MYRLTDDEIDTIQAYLEKASVELSEAGLTLHIDGDTGKWVRFMESAPGIARINTTYDPRYSNANSENSFWIYLENQTGQIVGCVCSRVFETDNFLDLIRSNLLFYDRQPIFKHFKMQFSLPENCPVLSGKVGHGGGLWVHPDYRGAGLSAYIPSLVRAFALRHFDIDWNTVASKNTANRRALAKESYGYDQAHIATTGYWPPYGENLDVQIFCISRDMMLEQMQENLFASSRLKHAALPTTAEASPSGDDTLDRKIAGAA